MFPSRRHVIKNVNDERVFIILYAVSAVYFAGVMVRLMLTLTPCVCVLAGKLNCRKIKKHSDIKSTSNFSTAIAFSKVFELYLKEDDAEGGGKPKGVAAAGASSSDATSAEGATADKNGRLYDKVST